MSTNSTFPLPPDWGQADSEALLQALNDNYCHWQLSLTNGLILQVNERFCETVGHGADSLIGQPFDSLISDRHEAPSPAGMWAAMQQGQSWRGELCFNHRLLNQFWLECLLIPVPSSACTESLPGLYLGFGREISEFKHLQLTLSTVENADNYFARREQELLKAQHLAHIGSWNVDYLTGALEWSDETFRIFGLEPGEAKPDDPQFWALIPEEDHSIVQNSLANVEKTGRHDIVHRIIRPDGTMKYVHVLGEAEYSEQGKLLRIVGTMQDITQRIEAEQALIKAREEADTANRAKSDFLSSMSHELRTPLNAILGFAQVLHYDESLAEMHRDSAEEIVKAGRHLLALINDILDLSKVEAGQIAMNIRPVALKELLHSVCSLMQSLALRQDVTLVCQLEPSLSVQADRTRLQQIALNLISNAIKYNLPGGEVVISSEYDRANGRVTLIIEDSGLGIPQERRTELFQPFNRLGQESSDIEGTGIGLRICQQLAQMMDGEIGMEERRPRGSRFWLRLPLAGDPS